MRSTPHEHPLNWRLLLLVTAATSLITAATSFALLRRRPDHFRQQQQQQQQQHHIARSPRSTRASATTKDTEDDDKRNDSNNNSRLLHSTTMTQRDEGACTCAHLLTSPPLLSHGQVHSHSVAVVYLNNADACFDYEVGKGDADEFDDVKVVVKAICPPWCVVVYYSLSIALSRD